MLAVVLEKAVLVREVTEEESGRKKAMDGCLK